MDGGNTISLQRCLRIIFRNKRLHNICLITCVPTWRWKQTHKWKAWFSNILQKNSQKVHEMQCLVGRTKLKHSNENELFKCLETEWIIITQPLSELKCQQSACFNSFGQSCSPSVGLLWKISLLKSVFECNSSFWKFLFPMKNCTQDMIKLKCNAVPKRANTITFYRSHGRRLIFMYACYK